MKIEVVKIPEISLPELTEEQKRFGLEQLNKSILKDTKINQIEQRKSQVVASETVSD